MNALATIQALGAQPRLAPDGRLVVAGLDRLPYHQATKALEVAKLHRAEVLAELAAQADLNLGASSPASVTTPTRPNLSPAPGQETWSCWWCGHDRFSLNTARQPVCALCHPPVDPIRFPIHG